MDKADHEESFLVPNMEDIFNCEFPLNLSFKFGVDNQENLLTLENQEHILTVLREDWKRRQKLCTITLICYIVHMLYLLRFMSTRVDKSISHKLVGREQIRATLMQQLRETHRCRDILRMGPDAFLQLCEKLRATRQVRDTKHVTVEEQVARFLYIIAHNVKTRTVSFFYHRSGETVSRHFHAVLRAIILLEDEFLRQPSASIVSPAILHNHRFYPYFKDCIGAIDGTHFRVKVPIADQPKFRGRKDWPTQNVLAACDFDMKFTYVLTGWKGIVSDSKVLKNALSRDDNLKLPRGKFYLGDAGFMLKHGLITPYRSVRYHLKEYARRGPENEKELFNLRHASLRNVIERSFGVLKKRFAIITSGTEPHYDFETMTEIVLACCILHNFLMGVDSDPHLIAQVDRELQENNPEEDEVVRHEQDEDYRRGAILRDEIAAQMWADYQLGL
ncbi:putative nuclease HARBI1 isoform X1 [Arachis ipaensis]|uniref:putative nuclease HARBI1 isoform X1 n=1 Tax=Arachis ipaensis TaxID=130454 RepID=UPI0007AFA506|nr:putative nuclease HARBI1 isoform X1 [Arachis ipaensis]